MSFPRKQVKVCGLIPDRNQPIPEADFLGMIFHPASPRYVKDQDGFEGRSTVGVFVNETAEHILAKCRELNIHIVQLHGEESVDLIQELSNEVEVWKAISISQKEDLDIAREYAPHVSRLIFDTKGKYRGGNGRTFDWGILLDYKEDTPFMLSGGLSLELISEIKDFDHPALIGYDINSRFEIEPGRKDWDKVYSFIQKIKRA